MVGAVMGGGAVLIGPKLLQIYSSDPEVISYGMMRMRIINGSYFLCGIMDTMVGGLRGLGYSVVPMLVVPDGRLPVPGGMDFLYSRCTGH